VDREPRDRARGELDEHFVFGFEEALGYTVDDLVRDKDGVSAAVIFAELTRSSAPRARPCSSTRRSLPAVRPFTSAQVSITRKGAAGIAELKRSCEAPREPAVADRGARRHVRARLPEPDDHLANARGAARLAESDVLTFTLASGSRVIARPSGTEPKAKFYFDVREPIEATSRSPAAEARAAATTKKLSEAFVAIATG